MVTQALLIRQLVVVFFGNELALGIIFSCWFFWLACGSLILGRLVDRVKEKIKCYINLQVLFALLLPPTLFGIKAIRAFWNIPPGELIGFIPFLISTFIFLAGPGLILGLQFALACRIYAQEKAGLDFCETPKAVGKIYLFDALGNMLGGAVFACLFVNLFHSFETIFILGILNLSLAVILSRRFLKKKSRLVFGFFLLLLIFVYSFNSSLIDKLYNYACRLEWKNTRLKEVRYSKYNDYAVLKDGHSFYVYGNGRLIFSVPEEVLSEEIIHLALSEIEKPRRVLLIGGGISGAVAQTLKYADLKKVYYLEKDPKLIELAQDYISPRNKEALADSRTHLVIGDGRLFVKQFQGEKFDAVILNAANPLTAEANRYYTVDFFKEVKKILQRDGVFFLGIDSHENYLSAEMRKFNGCIYRSLKTVFPNIVFFPGGRLYLAASPGGNFLTDNPLTLSQRLAGRNISSRYINEYTLPDRLSPGKISYIQNILLSEEKDAGPLNSDFRPISYHYNLRLWGSKFLGQRAAEIFAFLSRIKAAWLTGGFLLIGLILIILKRKLKGIFMPIVVFVGGLAGISLELLLIIGFQIIYGSLYFMIGLIIASFMMGLVIGAGFITRRLEKIKKAHRTLSRIELGLGFYALFTAAVLLVLARAPGVPAFIGIQILFPFFTAVSGFWVGMIFPLANKISLINTETAGKTAGKLYAFDLLGAAAGALVTTACFIPLFGLIQTALLIGVICALGAALLLSLSV